MAPRTIFIWIVDAIVGTLAHVGAAAIILVIAALWFLGDWCSGEGCTIQGWLSATSGWAAFFATVVTAFFVYGQMKDARNQATFALGFAKPTAVMHDKLTIGLADFNSNEIHVVNWNRFPVVFTSMRILHGSGATIADVRCTGATLLQSADGLPAIFTFFRFFLVGWLDRSVAPPQMMITVKFDSLAAVAHQDFVYDRKAVEIQLVGRIVGPKHEQFSIMVSRPDAIVN